MANLLTRQQQDDVARFVRRFGLLGKTVGRMELSQLKNVLLETEKVESMIYGVTKGAFVMMIATNERLHFIDQGLFNSRIDDYEYSRIESIEYDLSLVAGMVRIFAAQGTIKLKFVPNRLLNEFVTVVESHMGRKLPKSVNGGGKTSEVDKLEKLSKLHQKGELTDEEFKVEKTKIIT